MSGYVAGGLRSKMGKIWSNRINGAGLARFLRAKHPEKTAPNVAAETGLPIDSVKKWLSGEALPGSGALLTLACVYGPELMAAMLNGAPAWLDHAVREQKIRELEAQQARIAAELQALEAR